VGEFAGEFVGRVSGSAADELLPVLTALRGHQHGAKVVDLAEALHASVGLVEKRLWLLKAEGLVTSGPAGDPPVTTWRAAP
jgi:hypothetical protein